MATCSAVATREVRQRCVYECECTVRDLMDAWHTSRGAMRVHADPPGGLDVDFAPYQKVPREKQRKDAKMGTIDRDPEYLAFLDELAKPKEVSEREQNGRSRGVDRERT